jgi:hypothetical protein
MNTVSKIGKTIWEFLMLMGEARVQRDIMVREAIRKHGLGR